MYINLSLKKNSESKETWTIKRAKVINLSAKLCVKIKQKSDTNDYYNVKVEQLKKITNLLQDTTENKFSLTTRISFLKVTLWICYQNVNISALKCIFISKG